MFKFINSKGQSSSVFNLLIAALVALAILGLLLSILGGIGFNSGNKPSDTAAKEIKNAISNPYVIQSDVVTFDKTSDKSSISAQALAEKADVGSDQIIFKNCGLGEEFDDSGSILKYLKHTSKKYQLYTVCGSDKMDHGTTGIPESCGELDNSGQFTCYIMVTHVK